MPLTVALIGAGMSGRSFALACAAAGFRVILEDVMPSNLRRAEAEFASLGRTVELAMTVEDAVREADLAIDFVPDELESKLEIFSMIDRMAPPKTVMLTPSQALSITDLASCTYRPDRCVMMRESGHGLKLIHPAEASDEALALVSEFLGTLGHDAQPEIDPDLPQLMKNMGYAVGG